MLEASSRTSSPGPAGRWKTFPRTALIAILLTCWNHGLHARTLVVWNSDLPASRELADRVARERGTGTAEVIGWSFGEGDAALPGSVNAFRKQYLDDRSISAVVLAFETPRHHMTGLLGDPLQDALRKAPFDYGRDAAWSCTWSDGRLPERQAPAVCEAPPDIDIGLFFRWLPEHVGVVELRPGTLYNCYQAPGVLLPDRNLEVDGNGARVRFHPGGTGVHNRRPANMTEANAMTHHRYFLHDLELISGDVGISLHAVNHADIARVQCTGQRIGIRTEMALSTTLRHCKVTHPDSIGIQITYGDWERGGRYRAPSVKVGLDFCEVYLGKEHAVGVVWDNVEGGSMRDGTVQGGAARHDVVVTATGERTYSARLEQGAGNSSVVKHLRIERLHIEGHHATEGSIYVNMPPLATIVLDQIMWHGHDGIPLVYGGGQVVVSNLGWVPGKASIRTRVAAPKIRFLGCPGAIKDLPVQNLHRMDKGSIIDLSGVQYLQGNW